MDASLTFVLVLLFCSGLCDCRKLDKENEISPMEGCKVDNKVYKVGEHWSKPGVCMLFTCYEGGAYGSVTCPLVRFRENSGCHLTDGDNKKPYPDCCPQVVCPKTS